MNIIELNNKRLQLESSNIALLEEVESRLVKLLEDKTHTVDNYVTEHHVKIVSFYIDENDDVECRYIYGHVFNQFVNIPCIFFEIENDIEATSAYREYLKNMV